MSTDAGVSRTGSPNRLALVATVLSGVIGIPARLLGGVGSGFGAGGSRRLGLRLFDLAARLRPIARHVNRRKISLTLRRLPLRGRRLRRRRCRLRGARTCRDQRSRHEGRS